MAKLEDDSDFFLIFNSDAMIKTLNWDLLLKSYNPGDYLILHHNMVNGRGSGDYSEYANKIIDLCFILFILLQLFNM